MDPEELLRQSKSLVRRQREAEAPTHRIGELQPGEDPTSDDPEDAEHWASVYRELVEFKSRLVDEVGEGIQRSTESAVRAELAHDKDQLSMELERLRIHFSFWKEKVPKSVAG